jgi:hypothetical protein
MFRIISDSHAKIGDVDFTPVPGVKIINDDTGAHWTYPTIHQGVQLTFANGLTLSIMWGTGNYCEARGTVSTRSDTAEIAVLRDGNVLDDVAGWVDPATVLALIPHVVALHPAANPSLHDMVQRAAHPVIRV